MRRTRFVIAMLMVLVLAVDCLADIPDQIALAKTEIDKGNKEKAKTHLINAIKLLPTDTKNYVKNFDEILGLANIHNLYDADVTLAIVTLTGPKSANGDGEPDDESGRIVTKDNIGNIEKGKTLILEDGTIVLVKYAKISDGRAIVIVVKDGKEIPLTQEDLIGKVSFKDKNVAAGAPEAKEGEMPVAGKDKPLKILKGKDLLSLYDQIVEDGAISTKDVVGAKFSVDSNGNVYMQRAGETTGTLTSYIRLSDKQFQYAPIANPTLWSTDLEEDLDREASNVRIDPTTGQMYVRRNDKSRWERSFDPRSLVVVDGKYVLASGAYGREIDGVLPGLLQWREDFGDDYTYYYYNGKNWVDLNTDTTAMNKLRDTLEDKFGEDWAKEYAQGKPASEIMNNIDARLGSQQFWETFFDGSPDILYQTVEEQLTAQWGWDDIIAETEWMQSNWWDPENWETAICENIIQFDVDYPESVSSGYTELGPQMTMRLEASKQLLPANETFYQISWLVTPAEGKIDFTVCYGKCSQCIPIQDSNVIEAPNINSGFHTEYVPIDLFDYVSICYSREVDDVVVEVDSFERPIVVE